MRVFAINPATLIPSVSLSTEDILTILAASKSKGITVATIAEKLGLVRTYFYSLFSPGFVDLRYVIQVQRILELELITAEDITRCLHLIHSEASTLFSL